MAWHAARAWRRILLGRGEIFDHIGMIDDLDRSTDPTRRQIDLCSRRPRRFLPARREIITVFARASGTNEDDLSFAVHLPTGGSGFTYLREIAVVITDL